jgi:hypothetical protein
VIISANVAPEPAPLNALIWVFGVAGGAALVLALSAMALAANHKHRREGDRYHLGLSALADHLKGSRGEEGSLKESVSQPPQPGQTAKRDRVLLADSTRVLTTGDLVMDPAALQSVAEIATELQRMRR